LTHAPLSSKTSQVARNDFPTKLEKVQMQLWVGFYIDLLKNNDKRTFILRMTKRPVLMLKQPSKLPDSDQSRPVVSGSLGPGVLAHGDY
jgi:hypothetical protein